MHRTQISIQQEQYRLLLDEAQRTGKSISAVLRDWIDERIRSKRQGSLKRDPLWGMVGIARGGTGKVSEEHDKYLSEGRRKRISSQLKRCAPLERARDFASSA
jgi:hypothetical protein